MVTARTAVPCAFRTLQLPTDWYLPDGGPVRGLVYLQHGFAESRNDWREFAALVAAAGFVVFAPTLPKFDVLGCTVQNLLPNHRFLAAVGDLFLGIDDPAGALRRSFAAALDGTGRLGVALPTRLAIIGHSAGGEAALTIASRLTGDPGAPVGDPAPVDLRCVVLADPVRSIVGDTMSKALRVLARTAVPIRVLAAPPSSCNARQSGTRTVLSELAGRSFLGALITAGSHADIFGGSVNRLERRTCGAPRQPNINAVQSLALGWLTDALTDATTDGMPPDAGSGMSPGGAGYDRLVARGIISTLP